MPLDVLGCTRATLMRSTSLQSCLKLLGTLFKMHRDGDRSLQFLIFNDEDKSLRSFDTQSWENCEIGRTHL